MMVCIIMYKYAFVNTFCNIFANLCILLPLYMYASYPLCIITNFLAKSKGAPPVSGRCARVRILFYALSMHNIPFVMNWTVFSKKYKSFIYYHMKASFATGYFIPHCARRPSIRSSINNVSLCGISGHSDSPASIAFIQLRTSYS